MSKSGKFPLLNTHIYKNIKPLTDNQNFAYKAFVEEQKCLFMHGCAGTGKTFLALWMALNELTKKDAVERKLIIIRSSKGTEDTGFLPGTYEEKLEPYESVYKGIFNQITKTKNNYDELKRLGALKFMDTRFIRGETFDDSIIIVDEAQNLNFHQLDSCFTRIGENSRIIFCGDRAQSDLSREKDKNGVCDFMRIMDAMLDVRTIEFNVNDIVRSGIVRDYLQVKEQMKL